MPPASRPIASIFWACTSRCSSSRLWVTSSLLAMKCVISPRGSSTGEITAFSQNSSPLFFLLHSSPCQVSPDVIVAHSSR